jgi:hypothetical protein
LASFPFTSMAICSSTSMNLSTDKRFFRRAIEAARHGLILNFVSTPGARLGPSHLLRRLLAIVRMYAAVGCDTRPLDIRDLGAERRHWR